MLRAYRARLPLANDPFIEDYTTRLIRMLAYYSDLDDKRLDILILDSPTLNAFAAPGGIVGVNKGTFLVAQTQQQFASIMAHELAHLSQRHHARNLQEGKTRSIVNLAATLAAVLVAASSDSSDGIAAIPAINAATIDAQLRFSRQLEIEADRVGMDTLANAGFSPYAMPEMFELMQRSARYRSRPPEFLLTHPLTERRIADSRSRADRYPARQYSEDEQYQFVRARAILHYETNPQLAVKRFRNELSGSTLSPLAARYGLTLALVKAGEIEQARETFKKLSTLTNDAVILTTTEAAIDAKDNKMNRALEKIRTALKVQPTNHPLNIRYAELLMEAGQYKTCQNILIAHKERKPDNAYVWYLLAEVNGLVGDILAVHKARAEYFILHGIYHKAEIQLYNALRLIEKKDFQARAKIEQRLLDVKTMRAKIM